MDRPFVTPLLLLAVLMAVAPPPAAAQLLAFLAGSPRPAPAQPAPAQPVPPAPEQPQKATTAAEKPALPPAGGAGLPASPALDDPTLARRIARANGTAIICISPQPAQVVCSPSRPDDEPKGYQIDVLRFVIHNSNLGIHQNGYRWRCMDWQPMIDDLASPTGECYMVPGVDIFAEYTDQGIRFSWPDLTQGLKILTVGSMESHGMWSMFNAFHSDVWLALLFTIVLVGVLLGIMQRCSTFVSEVARDTQDQATAAAAATGVHPTTGPPVSPGDAVVTMPPSPVKAPPAKAPKPRSMRRALRHQLGLRRGQRMAFAGHMGDHVWQALAVATTMSEGGIDPPRSLPGRIIYATFLFLLLVMLSMFTANTAGIITSLHLTSAVHSRSDLAGKAVGVWEGYAPLLESTEIAAVPLPWENDDDLRDMIGMLYAGSVKAILIDASSADNLAVFNGSCHLHVIGEPIQEWGSGFAFPANTSDATLDAWNEAMLSIQQTTDELDVLRDKYLGLEMGECAKVEGIDQYRLNFGQVAGLWVILAVATGLACLLLVALFLGRHNKGIRDIALASLDDGADSRRRRHPGSKRWPSFASVRDGLAKSVTRSSPAAAWAALAGAAQASGAVENGRPPAPRAAAGGSAGAAEARSEGASERGGVPDGGTA